MTEFKTALTEAFKGHISASDPVALSEAATSFSVGSLQNRINVKKAALIERDRKVQDAIRTGFGKVGSIVAAIGDHPDFKALSGTDQAEYHYIATLFMDVAGSTRLGRLYPLDKVKRIKNGFMCLAIEIVQAFDGHVHRLQGDAVMAYFGGKKCTPDQACVDALNAASLILYFAEKIVEPELKKEGISNPPGIRLGIDYGKNEDVYWSSYGYPGTSEVTATSYYVDMAAKLQHAAPRNGLMLGNSIVEHLDIPEHLLEVRTSTSDGKEVQEPFVLPNYSDDQGKKFNYRQWVFNATKYLRSTPIAEFDPDLRTGSQSSGSFNIQLTVHTAENGLQLRQYSASSSVLKKDEWVKFKLALPITVGLPYQVTFIVKNHGRQAKSLGGETFGNHETSYTIKTFAEHSSLEHWEHAAFRGLHYMTVKIKGTYFSHERKVGIYVE